MDRVMLGREGEAIARSFLIAQGYEIIETNYRLSFGEIDIVAKDGATLCFIEVKTRENDEYGHPFEAVTPSKQRTIRKVAQMYLLERDIDDQYLRFDVAAVFYQGNGAARVELLKDAF